MGKIKSISSIVVTALSLAALTGCDVFRRTVDTSKSKLKSTHNVMSFEAGDSTTLSRWGSYEFYLRISALYPNQSLPGVETPAKFLSYADPTNYGFVSTPNTLVKTFQDPTRPTDVLSEVVMKDFFTKICQAAYLNKSTVFSETDILLPGEALPSDPAHRAAFVASRNIWQYPYEANHPGILALKKAYEGAVKALPEATAAATKISEGKRMVCVGAFLAPPFWKGNAGEDDVVRTIAMRLGHRKPKFSDFAAYRSGAKDTIALVKEIQQEPAYTTLMYNLHETFLGMRPISLQHSALTNTGFSTELGALAMDHVPANFGPYTPSPQDGANQVLIIPTEAGIDGCMPPAPAALNGGKNAMTYREWISAASHPSYDTTSWRDDVRWDTSPVGQIYSSLAAQPAGTVLQAFDPRTTGVYVSHYNTVSKRFEVLGGFVLNDNRFKKDLMLAYGLNPNLAADQKLFFNPAVAPAPQNQQLCKLYAVDQRFLVCRGRITMSVAPLTYKMTEVSDVRFGGAYSRGNGWAFGNAASLVLAAAQGDPDANAPGLIYGGLAGTPLQPTTNTLLASQARVHPERRIVRLSPSGPMTGYSVVTDYVTHQKKLICNSMARLAATCRYRPNDVMSSTMNSDPDNLAALPLRVVEQNPKAPKVLNNRWYAPDWHYGNPIRTDFVTADKTPRTFRPMVVSTGWEALEQIYGDRVSKGMPLTLSYAYPEHLENFRCGHTQMNELNKSAAAYNDVAAFPYGYDPIGEAATAPASWTATPPAPASLRNLAYVANMYAVHNYGTRSIANEPYHLINDILEGKTDYFEIVTGKYVVTSKLMELLYRGQGRLLPEYPARYTPPGQGNNLDYRSVVKVHNSELNESYPRRLLVNPNGGPKVVAEAVGSFDISRSHNGVLTMPALWGPMQNGGLRGVMARVFLRFLCGLPSIYDPRPDGKENAHREAFLEMVNRHDPAIKAQDKAKFAAFVKSHLYEEGTNNIRQDCMSCHRNLDPGGMALFRYYGQWANSPGFKVSDISGGPSVAVPEKGANVWAFGPSQMSTSLGLFGVTQNVSAADEGMFLGHEVLGWEEFGEVLGNHHMFRSCVVKTAFENFYGRKMTFPEERDILPRVSNNFNRHRNWNQMMQELVADFHRDAGRN